MVAHTHTHTDTHPYFINIYRLGLRPLMETLRVSVLKDQFALLQYQFDSDFDLFLASAASRHNFSNAINTIITSNCGKIEIVHHKEIPRFAPLNP